MLRAAVLALLLALPMVVQAQASAKDRLKAETGSQRAAPAPPQSSVKAQVNEATGAASKPASTYQGLIGEEKPGACGFLTKPSVRADGGGLNRHANGQFLCHAGVAKRCVDGRWRAEGPCWKEVPMANELEGTPAPGDVPSEGGQTGRGSGFGGSGGEGDGGSFGSGRDGDDLDRRERELRQAEAAMSGAGGDPEARAGSAGGASTNPAAVAKRCAEMRQAISSMEQRIRQIEDYSKQVTNGGIASDFRNAYQLLTSKKREVQQQMARECR